MIYKFKGSRKKIKKMKNILFFALDFQGFQGIIQQIKKQGGNTMRLKLNRAARKIMEKKIWRDTQIKGIEADLNFLEDNIRDNWTTIGYGGREVLYSAHDYIEKYLNNRDKRIVTLKEWVQEVGALADERASFSSCIRQ